MGIIQAGSSQSLVRRPTSNGCREPGSQAPTDRAASLRQTGETGALLQDVLMKDTRPAWANEQLVLLGQPDG